MILKEKHLPIDYYNLAKMYLMYNIGVITYNPKIIRYINYDNENL